MTPEQLVYGLQAPAHPQLAPDGDPGRTYQRDFYVLEPGARELRQLTEGLDMVPHAGYPGWMPPSPPVWLDEAGVDCEFARYPGAAHLFPFIGRPDQRQDFLERVVEWFDRHQEA